MTQASPLRLAGPLPRVLGQVVASPLLVEVVDSRGRPVGDVTVSVYRGDTVVASGRTDGSGDVALSVPGPGGFTLRAEHGHHVLYKEVGPEEARGTVFVTFPFCYPGPALTTAEVVGLLGGGAVTAIGFLTKQEALKVGGEILIGAAVFNLIYRFSCP